MFLILQKSDALTALRAAILPASFLFLVQFGVTSIIETKKKYHYLKALPFILIISWAVIVLTSSQRLLMGDIWARYLIGAPGIFLTSYALIIRLKEFKEIKLSGPVTDLKLAAGIFISYGFFAGLIVPKAGFFPTTLFNYAVFMDTVGLPVQIFRAFAAIVAAYSMTRVLDVFHYETLVKVKESE